ncbi:hypothetical protein [Ammonifex thiophilus]|nr:hypothetical protein [Ammonifex thiophilus]
MPYKERLKYMPTYAKVGKYEFWNITYPTRRKYIPLFRYLIAVGLRDDGVWNRPRPGH